MARPLIKELLDLVANSRKLSTRPGAFSQAKQELGEALRAGVGQPDMPVNLREIAGLEHSTSRLFLEPRVERQLAATGQGDYWEMPGFYQTDSPPVAAAYRESTAQRPQLIVSPRGNAIDLWDFQKMRERYSGSELEPMIERLRQQPKYTEADYLLGRAATTLRSPDEVMRDEYTRGAEMLEELRGRIQELLQQARTPQVKSRLKDALETYNSVSSAMWMQRKVAADASRNPALAYRLVEPEAQEATYRTSFFANPEELFELDVPVYDQPATSRLLAALRETPAIGGRPAEDVMRTLYSGSRNDLMDLLAASARPRLDRLQDLREILVPVINPRISTPERIKEANSILVGNRYPALRQDLFPTRGSGWETDEALGTEGVWDMADRLRQSGIVGTKYLTGTARRGGPTAFNYVANDPSRVVLRDVYGALLPYAAPAAGAGGALAAYPAFRALQGADAEQEDNLFTTEYNDVWNRA